MRRPMPDLTELKRERRRIQRELNRLNSTIERLTGSRRTGHARGSPKKFRLTWDAPIGAL